ncbi:hypothetical protein C5E45_03320 [Nocardia nova]|uniref:DUF8017 domain-containing protein n=2 Tax=Nocardia nova TaxID=37330 RepID=A0A2S6AY60_9NOCA|nr:hypothetical protein C5E45_03320 [Nocardia nova]
MPYFSNDDRYHRIAKQVGTIVALVGVIIVAAILTVRIANSHQRVVATPEQPPSVWHAPPGPSGPADPPLPSGFPSMAVPPPMSPAPKGGPQTVPTRYGLSYTVPTTGAWRPSNERVMGWTSETTDQTIVSYGAVSDYGYCPQTDGSALANVGARGRNGIDIETAAREEISKAEEIFGAADAGRKAIVTVSEPARWSINGRPAVRYRANISGIPRKHSCDATEAEFDVIATPAYSSAEVAVFVIEREIGPAQALTAGDVDTIAASIQKTRQ